MKTIPLTRGMVALVDDQDYEDLAKFRWYAAKQTSRDKVLFYARRKVRKIVGNQRQQAILMHRCLLICDGAVDHKDGDGLNNQRDNLRSATGTLNLANQRHRVGGSSKWKGVVWHKRCRKWQAQVFNGGDSHYLGLFAEEADAAQAYNFKAEELFGEFARSNDASQFTPHE